MLTSTVVKTVGNSSTAGSLTIRRTWRSAIVPASWVAWQRASLYCAGTVTDLRKDYCADFFGNQLSTQLKALRIIFSHSPTRTFLPWAKILNRLSMRALDPVQTGFHVALYVLPHWVAVVAANETFRVMFWGWSEMYSWHNQQFHAELAQCNEAK